MGYEIIKDQEKNKWLCQMPDGSKVDLFDFYYGKAGQEYSYCAKKGYKTKSHKVSKGVYSLRFPVCYQVGGSMKHLHEFMNEQGDYYDMFDIPLGAPLPPPPPDSILEEEELPDPPNPEPPDPGYPTFFRYDHPTIPSKNFMNEIEDQGDSGTCYAHATAAAADGAYNKFHNYTSESTKINFSQAFLAFCGRQNETSCWYGLHGSQGVAAFPFTNPSRAHTDYNYLPQMMVATHGIIDENDFPWIQAYSDLDPDDNQQFDPDCTHWEEKRYRFKSWERVDTTRLAIKQALLDYGPLIANVDNTGDFSLYFESPEDTNTMAVGNSIYGSDIGDFSPMAHAICIVGWGYDYTDDLHYWIIHNSKTGWGDYGVGRVYYNTAGIMYEVAYLEYLPTTIIGGDLACDLNSITNLGGGTFNSTNVNVDWGYNSFSCRLISNISSIYFQYPKYRENQPNVDFPLVQERYGFFDGRWDTLKFYIEYEKGGMPGSCSDNYNYDTISKPVWVGNPAVPTISGPSQMGCSSTAVFTISNPETIETSSSYEWTSTGVSIVGYDFNSSCTIQSYTGGPATVTVTAKNGHGESDSETFNITVLDCPMMSMIIYPNPAEDELNIEIETESDQDDYFTYELRDNHGNKRKIKEKAGKKIQWSISDLPEGTYYLKVKHKSKQSKTKQEKTRQVIISR